jgi:hypothetical protein
VLLNRVGSCLFLKPKEELVPGSVDLETGVGAWKFGVDNEQKSNVYRYQPRLCRYTGSVAV